MKFKLKTHSLLVLLFVLPFVPLSAQAQNEHLFRFVKGGDMFYVPWNGNGAALDSLLSMINANRSFIEQGRMYISVSSYAATGADAHKIGYTRNQRVKSELITRGGLSEKCFVTDRVITEPYNGERDVVVVVLPASVEKVAAIAGTEAATKVEAYFEELRANSPEARRAAEAKCIAELKAQQKQKEEQAAAEEARLLAQKQKSEMEAAQQQPVAPATELVTTPTKPYTIALRANLLRWATLTPDLGIEWRVDRNWGVLVNGAWTSWSRDDKNRRYALWNISPEIHYYIGKEKRGYVGVMYHTGEFNYKLSQTGRQGSYHGGGITGGYQLPIGKCLAIDFSLGVGYTRADFEKYTVTNGVRVRQGNDVKNYWGVNRAGVTLVWKLF